MDQKWILNFSLPGLLSHRCSWQTAGGIHDKRSTKHPMTYMFVFFRLKADSFFCPFLYFQMQYMWDTKLANGAVAWRRKTSPEIGLTVLLWKMRPKPFLTFIFIFMMQYPSFYFPSFPLGQDSHLVTQLTFSFRSSLKACLASSFVFHL